MEDLFLYMKSLQTILDLNPQIIYPGHGPLVEDPITFVKNYIQHRKNRETQIFNYLKENSPKSFNLVEIRTQIYKVRKFGN